MVLSCAIKQVIPTDSSQRQSRHIHTNCRMWWERYARLKQYKGICLNTNAGTFLNRLGHGGNTGLFAIAT